MTKPEPLKGKWMISKLSNPKRFHMDKDIRSAVEFYKKYRDEPQQFKIDHPEIYFEWNNKERFKEFILRYSFEDVMKNE